MDHGTLASDAEMRGLPSAVSKLHYMWEGDPDQIRTFQDLPGERNDPQRRRVFPLTISLSYISLGEKPCQKSAGRARMNEQGGRKLLHLPRPLRQELQRTQ